MSKSNLALVTGGAGFIGSHLVEALLGEGYRVRVVDNLATGRLSNLAHLEGRFEWIEGNVADFAVCRRAAEGVDYVFHQAAIPSVPRSVREPLPSHESGPTATINMLEAARLAGVRRFMFAASSSAYGDTIELPKHEGMLPQPLSPYAAGKLAGEHYVRVYAQTMGLDGVSLRYFNIFGPRQDPSSPYSGVISLFIKRMSQGQRPTIFGDGDANPRLYLRGQCRGRQPRRDAASRTAGWGCLQRRGRGADSTPRPGRFPEPDFRDESRTRIPAFRDPATFATRWPAWTESARSSAISRSSLFRRG